MESFGALLRLTLDWTHLDGVDASGLYPPSAWDADIASRVHIVRQIKAELVATDAESMVMVVRALQQRLQANNSRRMWRPLNIPPLTAETIY